MDKLLKESDYLQAAELLGCEVAAIKAVAEVESTGSGFLDDGITPKILFERHYFHDLTGGKYDKSYPDISNEAAGGYGTSSRQHARLQVASGLDRDAAMQSASWGKFQIMGKNYALAGFKTLQAFINAMYDSEASHLKAFVNFIISTGLKPALQKKDWTTFARKYNGKNYYKNKYDEKMASAYKKYKK
ncbi:N-acetylmuramidase family protein [uncultured Chryseobacterium sp.]|uniref:N-acetylmuramidase family protein n=1 Tax=uncultured Chryseobacterium sp. TaxID=259322 RepID=UPI0025F0A4C2|nr:N-acetylmuramidase family protein [uncultured Chryseobacterium sp.]